MANVTATFSSITRKRFLQIRARIRAQADKISCSESVGYASAGHASGDSMEIEWLYTEAEQKLIITCTKRPLWRTEGNVQNRIRGLVEAL
jgi:hypothetical protein